MGMVSNKSQVRPLLAIRGRRKAFPTAAIQGKSFAYKEERKENSEMLHHCLH